MPSSGGGSGTESSDTTVPSYFWRKSVRSEEERGWTTSWPATKSLWMPWASRLPATTCGPWGVGTESRAGTTVGWTLGCSGTAGVTAIVALPERLPSVAEVAVTTTLVGPVTIGAVNVTGFACTSASEPPPLTLQTTPPPVDVP